MDRGSARRHQNYRPANKHSRHPHHNPSSVTAATTTTNTMATSDQCDPKVWEIFSRNYSRAQTVLDRNRVLIQQVNENHQSRIPDNMVKNVALINEINQNISKVASLYSEFSNNFTAACHQQRPIRNGKGGGSTQD
ncbi:hypothetical protein SAY87_025964 [Trapa incisa]|uniref:Protein EARLY FLOWERING 4 domain-containing protein n=1 Tax=Trapa incisa TaxID=236973 RepID=A0AAN7GUP5_9MYRT|nr:hypothetical protein SAY87_025964 [Trapa incisa]